MRCPDDEELHAFLEGATEEIAGAAIEDHLSGCAACRRRAVSARTQERMLAEALASRRDHRALVARIMKAIRTAEEDRT